MGLSWETRRGDRGSSCSSRHAEAAASVTASSGRVGTTGGGGVPLASSWRAFLMIGAAVEVEEARGESRATRVSRYSPPERRAAGLKPPLDGAAEAPPSPPPIASFLRKASLEGGWVVGTGMMNLLPCCVLLLPPLQKRCGLAE